MDIAGSGLCRAAGFVIDGVEVTWGSARVNPMRFDQPYNLATCGRTFLEQAKPY
jgi:hypothetical protein